MARPPKKYDFYSEIGEVFTGTYEELKEYTEYHGTTKNMRDRMNKKSGLLLVEEFWRVGDLPVVQRTLSTSSQAYFYNKMEEDVMINGMDSPYVQGIRNYEARFLMQDIHRKTDAYLFVSRQSNRVQLNPDYYVKYIAHGKHACIVIQTNKLKRNQWPYARDGYPTLADIKKLPMPE